MSSSEEESQDSFPGFGEHKHPVRPDVYDGFYNDPTPTTKRNPRVNYIDSGKKTIRRTPLPPGGTLLVELLVTVWLGIAILWFAMRPALVVVFLPVVFVGFWCWFALWVVQGLRRIWAWVATQPVLYGLHIWSWQREKRLWEEREAKEREMRKEARANYKRKVRFDVGQEGEEIEQHGFWTDDDDYGYEYVPEDIHEKEEEEEAINESRYYGYTAPLRYFYATDGYGYRDGGDEYAKEGYSSWT